MEGRAPVRVATLEEYRHEPAVIQEQGEKPPKTLTMYPDHKYDGNKWGMAIDLTLVHGLQRVHDGLRGGEQHPGRRQGAGRGADARCTGSASITTSPATISTTTAVEAYHQPVPVHAVRERAVRGRLPGRGDDAQLGRAERHGLQPLCRHPVLLEQLSVQGAPLQLPPLSGLGYAEPGPDAQSGRHRAEPRRHGEVHVLRAAHQPGAHRRQARGPRRSATARSSRRARQSARRTRSSSATSTIRTARWRSSRRSSATTACSRI